MIGTIKELKNSYEKQIERLQIKIEVIEDLLGLIPQTEEVSFVEAEEPEQSEQPLEYVEENI